MPLPNLPTQLLRAYECSLIFGEDFLEEHRESSRIFVVGGLVYGFSLEQSGGHFVLKGNIAVRAPQPIRVRLDLTWQPQTTGYEVKSSCSCLEGGECRHAAALLSAACELNYSIRPDLEDLTAEPSPPAKSHSRSVVALEDVSPTETGKVDEAPQLTGFLKSWLDRLQSLTEAEEPDFMPREDTRMRLVYVLRPLAGRHAVELHLRTAKLDEEGLYEDVAEFKTVFKQAPPFLSPGDLQLLHSLRRLRGGAEEALLVEGPLWGPLFPKLLASGRAVWAEVSAEPLQMESTVLAVSLGWKTLANGHQKPTLVASGRTIEALPVDPLLVVDVGQASVHPISCAEPLKLVRAWLEMPEIPPQEADVLRGHLNQPRRGLSLPAPAPLPTVEVTEDVPRPRLLLQAQAVFSTYSSQPGSFGYDQLVRQGSVEFCYPSAPHLPFPYGAGPLEVTVREEERIIRLRRNLSLERDLADTLSGYGLRLLGSLSLAGLKPGVKDHWCFSPDSANRWFEFLLQAVPRLEARGWTVEQASGFNMEIVRPEAFFSDLREDEKGGWFELDCGVEINGRPFPILPAILAWLKTERQGTPLEELARLGQQPIMLPFEGKYLAFPADRLHRMLSLLTELFSTQERVLKAGRLPLHRLRAAQLLAAAEQGDMACQDPGLQELATQLGSGGLQASGAGWAHTPPPVGLKAELRPYQLDGFRWLSFLARHQLGGVLADDMGLGKTLQTLAMILAEKESGAMTQPVLIVAPKSVVYNWAEEAARFTPKLKTLIYSGQDRTKQLANFRKNDVVLTNYPILARDEDALAAFEFHAIILDEAQNIKNASARTTQAAQRLHARFRLCLTGTPMENHLGELWSLFHFLMPGYLGTREFFQHTFRDAIEKHGDESRQAYLRTRLGPVMLRRTKQSVLHDLPPKIETIHRVELSQAQKDLYETVRAAMDERIRSEIATRGAERSQIQILDALLKLRQICCDPRLLKMDAAKGVLESAKLDALMEVVLPLIAEGRRILLFSQFTEMLALIQQRLVEEGVEHLLLTGQTEDRGALVHAFQNGQAPVFLISLKAGGVGLNLTAADTVIHYDPWWNPAAENQATDRAHRMGQKNTVFIFKFICQDTIEEKILLLQRKKAALVQGLLEGENIGSLRFTEEDLAVLFQPLPDAK